MGKTSHDPIEIRLNRVEGQIKAVKKMYNDGKNCDDIIQQVQAARAALSAISGLLLTTEAKRCVKKGDIKKLENIVEKIFKTI